MTYVTIFALPIVLALNYLLLLFLCLSFFCILIDLRKYHSLSKLAQVTVNSKKIPCCVMKSTRNLICACLGVCGCDCTRKTKRNKTHRSQYAICPLHFLKFSIHKMLLTFPVVALLDSTRNGNYHLRRQDCHVGI